MIENLLSCALAASAGLVEMTSAHADPYTGPSFGKVTCAEYNQIDQNTKIAMWSWIEGYIAKKGAA